MARLKKEYGDKVKFYFIEYNQEEAKPVIEQLQVKKHPETFFIDENDVLVHRVVGYDESLETVLEEQVKALLK